LNTENSAKKDEIMEYTDDNEINDEIEIPRLTNGDDREKRCMGTLKDIPDTRKSMGKQYKEFFLGSVSTGYFIKYEMLVTLFSGMPGALGYALRKTFFPSLLKKCGKGVIFGQHITLRHPQKIEVGDNVLFEDNTVLDAKGDDNEGIQIGSNVVINRNSIISCTGGDIEIGDFSNIGPNNIIISESIVKIGKYVFTGGQTYMIAGGNHTFDRREIPIRFQQSISKGGIIMDDDIWIGASVTILDGVRIGKGAIIGSNTLVQKRIRPYTINIGVPSQVVKKRD